MDYQVFEIFYGEVYYYDFIIFLGKKYVFNFNQLAVT